MLGGHQPIHIVPDRLLYLLTEIPRRLTRMLLCRIFGAPAWHIASSINKPYIAEIVRFLNSHELRTAAEIGCGFCDILSQLDAPLKRGYDVDLRVIRAAQVYTCLTLGNITLVRFDFFQDSLPDTPADAWILVNWLHDFDSASVRIRLRQLFGSLAPKGIIIVDEVAGPGYKYTHDIPGIFSGLSCECRTISQVGTRKIYAIVKSAI